uniref:AlNc14C407G11427 protein n=1 Tax=Albugo laibachii Nc14 TaxID=890382 RepID=F0WZ18_9STRA|nr:AlNc14C407G11427 [Albugo laibachii Nc14]|eukprot:CCA26733.1 AlNc14C407G11427 [Albugo laibachii Nc14]
MLNRFVLSRNYERDSTHVQLIKSEFLYLPPSEGGLQVPLIERQLRKQRYQFLQQFTLHSSTATPSNWTLTGMEVIRCILPDFGPYRTLDILTISPRRHSTMVHWHLASSWWKQTCVWWHRSLWDVTDRDLPQPDRFINKLDAPIWFHIDSLLHFEQRQRSTSAVAHRRCLGMVPEPARSFRMRFAQAFRILSLRDFFGGRSTWFDSCSEFVLRLSTHEVGNPTDVCKTKLLRWLYVEVTQILRRIQPEGVLICPERSLSEAYPVQFGIKISDKKVFFPNIPRNQLFRVVGKAEPPDKPHPMLLHLAERDPSSASTWVKNFSTCFKRLRRRLLPIYSDILLRLAYSILPVRSRFWFLKEAHPDIILCTREHCGEVESYQHLFFDCSRTRPIWEEVITSWSIFFSVLPRWSHIACLRLPSRRETWKPFMNVVEDVWFALVAFTVHFIWTDRNRRLFDQSSTTPTGPAVFSDLLHMQCTCSCLSTAVL